MSILNFLLNRINPFHKPKFKSGDSLVMKGVPLFKTKVTFTYKVLELSGCGNYYRIDPLFGLPEVLSVIYIDSYYEIYKGE